MKIIRNGIEYELTPAEMREAYLEKKFEYLKDDIQCKAEEMDIELSDEQSEEIADRAEKWLGNNESLWESYWMTIEYVLEENVDGGC